MYKKSMKKFWLVMFIIGMSLIIIFLIVNNLKNKKNSSNNIQNAQQTEGNNTQQTYEKNKILSADEIKQQSKDNEELRKISMQLEILNDRLLDEYERADEYVEERMKTIKANEDKTENQSMSGDLVNNDSLTEENNTNESDQTKKELKEEYLQRINEEYNKEKEKLIQQLKDITEKISK